MKKIILAVLFIASFNSLKAQDLPLNASGKIEFTEVVEAEGFTDAQLKANAERWFNNTYMSQKSLTISADGMTLSDAHNLKSPQFEGVVNYTISISIKEGKYKYSITELKHRNRAEGECSGGKMENVEPDCREGKMPAKKWSLIKIETKAGIDKLIASMKAEMTFVEKAKGSDW